MNTNYIYNKTYIIDLPNISGISLAKFGAFLPNMVLYKPAVWDLCEHLEQKLTAACFAAESWEDNIRDIVPQHLGWRLNKQCKERPNDTKRQNKQLNASSATLSETCLCMDSTAASMKGGNISSNKE